MIEKRIEQIEKQDILSLISEERKENRTLEYKEQLPSGKEADIKEFLADVSSFTNAAGGDLIYGISEKRDSNGKPTGIPEKALGTACENVDAEKLRLESIIRTGIAPRLQRVQLRTVEGFEKGPILIIRIPKSLNPPHIVCKSESRFYSRNSSGKYPLDVNEIRSAFIASEDISRRLKQFRDERLANIIAAQTPVPIGDKGKAILHAIPFDSMSLYSNYSIDLLKQAFAELLPFGGSASFRFNIDGILKISSIGSENIADGYLQIFRNGVIEVVETRMISKPNSLGIPSTLFEVAIITVINSYIKGCISIGIKTPVAIMLTLQAVKGYQYFVSVRHSHGSSGYNIGVMDRDIVMLSEIVFDDFEISAGKLLRPLFDSLWQSAGYDRCHNYNENDEWFPER